MCGISGWFVFSGEPPEPEVLSRMLERIEHRGPDEQGRHSDGKVSLGMTRLSINDVEGGSQPYFNEDQKIVAVFNGEIYNFRELRADLEAKGHKFRSRTDGEVIVHLWEEYGSAFVEKLNGMFAIALWDGHNLHLFRDRFGIKPLYYCVVEGIFYFASELKCLIEAKGFARRLNHSALRSYLTLEYVPSPHCIYDGAHKLRPAHLLSVTAQDGVQQPKRYWKMPPLTADGPGTLEDWAERLREELRASVKRRLLSDVPLGVFLSGGLDSSSLTALMTELTPGQVQSFSIGFSEDSFDESSYSRMVAKHLGTEHHERILDPNTTLELIEPLYSRLDEPMADAAIIPTYLLSQFAREKVTVALAGEGADELLGGYPTYFAHQVAQPLTMLPNSCFDLLRRLVDFIPTSRGYLSWDFKVKRFASGLGLDPVPRHLTWMGSVPPPQVASLLLNPQPPAFHWTPTPGLGLVETIQELDIGTYLSEQLLVKLDRATMLTSLEGRVPFLDHTLVEKMAKLPTPYKLKFLDAKRVLKTALGDKLPRPVLERPKKGFGIPMADWLRGPLKHLMDQYLQADFLRAQGLFRSEPIGRMVTEHLNGKKDHRKPLWTLLVFQQWWQKYQPRL